MNDNRAHEYENYINSYGIQEIRREARQARLLKGSGFDASGKAKLKQLILRFAPVAAVIALLIFFFG